MCGIFGELSFGPPVARAPLLAMSDALAHRGPEGAGCWLAADGAIGLGHRRLAFLDLSPAGAQPMADEHGEHWLTFNGEIYNFPELRQELEALGHLFRSRCDAEVVLHAYQQWGLAALDRLDGMFAFGLWDGRNRRLLLARDRFGIKPLYWRRDRERLLFASELPALLAHSAARPEVSWAAVCDFLVYRYVPSPRTIWQGVAKLPPASYLLATASGEVVEGSYWQLPSEPRRPPAAEAAEEAWALLEDSVRRHVAADVPVGSLLSGGYDSSAIAGCLERLGYPRRTFALGFAGWEGSEHRWAEQVARRVGAEHRARVVGEESLALVERLAAVYAEPLADLSIVPTFAISHLAARHVKAVLSGEGADEVFGGYAWQRAFATALARGEEPEPIAFYAEAMAMGSFDRQSLAELLAPELHPHLPEDPWWFYRRHLRPELPPLKRIQHLDLRTFMAELVLTKVDRASMACSLEVRVPFLDRRLVEAVLPLADELCFRPGEQKPLLRAQLEAWLPPALLGRPKQGFVGPDAYYQDLGWYRRLLEEGSLVRAGVVRRPALAGLLAGADAWRLWKLAVLEHWYRRHVGEGR
jgi:asparagine synthase (glutamine-hydrolysing)